MKKKEIRLERGDVGMIAIPIGKRYKIRFEPSEDGNGGIYIVVSRLDEDSHNNPYHVEFRTAFLVEAMDYALTETRKFFIDYLRSIENRQWDERRANRESVRIKNRRLDEPKKS